MYIEGDGSAATVKFGSPSVYTDAVGDLSLVDSKWGPSISHFQVRSLRHPEQFPSPDSLRIAASLRDPLYATKVALAIKKKYGWSAWSAYKSGSYLPYKGKDLALRTGHPRASLWNV